MPPLCHLFVLASLIFTGRSQFVHYEQQLQRDMSTTNMSDMTMPSMTMPTATSATAMTPIGSAMPSSTLQTMTMLTPQFFPSYGSQRVQVSYGPFTAISSSIENGMKDFYSINATKPCSDCLITWMQAGLVYPNGTYANANTGMWLHHTVLETLGKSDAVCGNTTRGERFFASGNERSIVDICANGTDQAGYYIGPKDEFGMLVELMNEIEEPRPVVVTITYEYIPNPPQSFSRVTPVWLDIGNCTDSDMPAFNDTTFQYSMNPPWKANFAGRVTFTGGHLHDGGTHLTILQNNNTICDSVASYGLTPGYIEPAGSMNMSGMNMGMSMMDISNMSSCENTGVVNVGDEFSVTAYYNTSEYAPMLNSDGTLAPIMGIALIYIAPGNATTTTTSNTASSTTSATGSASTTSSTSSATGSTSTTSSNGDRVMVGSAGVLLACIVMGFLM